MNEIINHRISLLIELVRLQKGEVHTHFYIPDAIAGSTLMLDAVIPTGIASISSSGIVTETTDKSAGEAMTGYEYKGGYSFSGKLGTPITTRDGSGVDNVTPIILRFLRAETNMRSSSIKLRPFPVVLRLIFLNSILVGGFRREADMAS